MHIFWSASFLLPTTFLNRVDQHIRAFFQGEIKIGKGLKPVAWKLICKRLAFRGLGIMPVKLWAEASLLRQVWGTASRRKSIWVDWVEKRYIKSSSFWDIKIPLNCSWGLRGLFNARTRALQHVHHIRGDGASTFFWLDPWLTNGRLVDTFGDRAINDLGLGQFVKVNRFIIDERWEFPAASSNQLMDIA